MDTRRSGRNRLATDREELGSRQQAAKAQLVRQRESSNTWYPRSHLGNAAQAAGTARSAVSNLATR